jgi:hypothetical protein
LRCSRRTTTKIPITMYPIVTVSIINANVFVYGLLRISSNQFSK